jgi:hypothetical protein
LDAVPVSSAGNMIWKNNFYSNSFYQASETVNINQWYNKEIGNYYGDYFNQNPDATNNGIFWNLPYKISISETEDPYPLVEKYV